ncbi:MAG: hypothetical protein IKH54_01730 [Bacilli bacterium]|nr:hypothetical protein [Bacilli bacterium]
MHEDTITKNKIINTADNLNYEDFIKIDEFGNKYYDADWYSDSELEEEYTEKEESLVNTLNTVKTNSLASPLGDYIFNNEDIEDNSVDSISLESDFYIFNNKYDVSRNSPIGIPINFDQEISNNEFDIYKFLRFNVEYNKVLDEFSFIFDKKYPDFQDYFKKNLYNLNIFDSRKKYFFKLKNYLKNFIITGDYSSKSNDINIYYHQGLRSTLMHELLHMSSTLNYYTIGFLNYLDGNYIGRGLNEGYTEYLNYTQFSKASYYTYHNEVVIAKQVALLVDESSMPLYYFNGNLSGVISKLNNCNYFENNDFKTIVKKIDKMNSTKITGLKDYRAYLIRKELSKAFSKKIEDDHNKGNMDDESYERKKLLYVDLYPVLNNLYEDDATIEKKNLYYIIRDKRHTSVVPRVLIDHMSKRNKKNNELNEMFNDNSINNNENTNKYSSR